MLKWYFVCLLLMVGLKGNGQDMPYYAEKDLGYTYTPSFLTVKVYAPKAEALRLWLYKDGTDPQYLQYQDFTPSHNGTWVALVTGNHLNKCYTVQAKHNGKWGLQVTDPYAKTVSVNGNRVQIIALAATNPKGWENDKSPQFSNRNAMQDAILYELHIRDMSIHPSSGAKAKGKFAGFTIGTKNKQGETTGIAHLKALGITHVHLLPVFDFNSIDETTNKGYNWGYDPKNYWSVEGSYAANAYAAAERIKAFKTLVAALHKANISVVMDVVFNHTALTAESNFEQLAPGYYFRKNADGSFANASACGNETASEKPMMRQFMADCLAYWVSEYHIDGFRFDLMAIHDIATMNHISETLHALKPDVLLYGEGWAAGNPAYAAEKLAFKRNVKQLNKIAVFSDDFRDAIKGYVFDDKARGFINGNAGMTETIKFGVVGAMPHNQINMQKAFYDKIPYADRPAQVINYVDCHDNLILYDKLKRSAPEASAAELTAMQQMAQGLLLTAQGIPFLHAGSEFLRTKKGVENSYNAPDSINGIDWGLKTLNKSTFEWVQKLIALRKAHPLFRLATADAIQQQLHFLPLNDGTIAYTLTRVTEKDTWKRALVIAHGNYGPQTIALPEGNWKIAIANTALQLNNTSLAIPPLSFSVLYEE